MSNYLKPKAFGIDISDFSLKIANLKKRKNSLNLVSFGSSSIPPGIIEGGEVKDEKSLAEIIKKSLNQIKGEKIKTKYVVASLPEEKSFLDVVQIPLMKEEEIESAVRFEIESHIPLKLEEVYFDFQKIQSITDHKNYQEVLVTAVPKNIVEGYLGALKKAGFQPIALEVECLSVVRALIREEKISPPLLIIDFGGSRTTFLIFSGKSIRLTSSNPFSSQKLTKALSEKLKVSPKKAEKMKLKEGLIGEKKVSKVLFPLLTYMKGEIETHLEYYRSHGVGGKRRRGGKKIEKVLLCGGGANLKGLKEFFNSQLKLDVELGNPWVNILEQPLKEIPELPFEKSLSYTSALGLALRGIKYD